MTSPRYLLDTDTCSYIGRYQPPQVLTRFRELEAVEAALSIITYGELYFGAERSPMRDRALRELEIFTSAFAILPLPVEAAPIYGAIRAELAGKGQIIGGNDLWIAAHARAMELILVTNNEREFRRVTGLTIENWIN